MDPPQGFAGQVAKGDFYVLPVVLEGRRLELIIAVDSDFEPGQEPLKLGSVTTEEDTSEGEGARVLIVDDSRMSRQMLRNILEKDGYRVAMEASNGLEGLAAYMKCKPDLVTLDITMPEMDGLEALEKILAYDPKANAIMITAAGQQDKLMRALRAGAKYFISKPFNEDEILANIRKVLA
ncbi:MAG: response regulator [Lachnospiraceae bacterium]|nr:response regulator [Lachnospiraceae bacterium]